MKKSKSKSPDLLMTMLGVVAGSVGGEISMRLADKFAPNLNPFIKAAIPMGAGYFLAIQKNSFVKGAGMGMVGKGTTTLVAAFLPAGMNGIEDLFINAPAGQDILSLPAGQSILSEVNDADGNTIGYVTSAGDFIEAADDDEINGNEEMYELNGRNDPDNDQDEN